MRSGGKVSALKEGGRPAPEHPPTPESFPSGATECARGMAQGAGGGGVGVDKVTTGPLQGECGGRNRQASRCGPEASLLLQAKAATRAFHSTPRGPRPGRRDSPTSQPVKCQTGLNLPESGAELRRPGPQGPWLHLGGGLRGGGRERGVPEPPLDVKALKGPMSPAPRPDPAFLLPRSQSKLTPGARPSQLCPDVPRTRAKSARPARAASAGVGRASHPPSPPMEKHSSRPELTCRTFPVPGVPGPAEWG